MKKRKYYGYYGYNSYHSYHGYHSYKSGHHHDADSVLLFGRQAPEYVSEAYRELRTNLLYLPSVGRCKRIAITSATSGEGKTVSAINIAFSLSQLNQRVLLIDGDMRAAMIGKYLHMTRIHGLSEFLVGMDEVPTIVQYPPEKPEIDVLLTGKIPPNPSELLLSLQMEQLMTALAEEYDFIIIDTPPVNIVTDATAMIDFVDSFLLVVRNNYSNLEEVRTAVDKMEKLEANIGGFVLNDINEHSGRYGGYYGGRYGRYGRYGKYGRYKKYGYGKYGYGSYGSYGKYPNN